MRPKSAPDARHPSRSHPRSAARYSVGAIGGFWMVERIVGFGIA
jgi:hypothetical protein